MKISKITNVMQPAMSMLPTPTDKVSFGGFFRPCLPLKPLTDKANGEDTGAKQPENMVPEEVKSGSTLDILI